MSPSSQPEWRTKHESIAWRPGPPGERHHRWQRADAARFSFLLGIPAITIAGLVELKDALAASPGNGPLPLLVGIGSAAVVSWVAIDWLLKFLQRNSTWVFVAYRLLFGLLLLAWWGVHGAH